jgi:hypothetical protein
MRTLVGAIAVVAIGAASLAFVAAPRELPGPKPVVPADFEASIADLYGSYWEFLSDGNPSMVKPDVTIERFVTSAEWGVAMAACMNDRGFAGFRSNSDGGFGSTRIAEGAKDEENQSENVALYSCQVSFPTESSVAWGLDDDQLDYLYDYYVSRLRPCLASHGHLTSIPPEREAFVGHWSGTFWSPYDDLGELPAAEFEAARLLCPVFPADLVPDELVG